MQYSALVKVMSGDARQLFGQQDLKCYSLVVIIVCCHWTLLLPAHYCMLGYSAEVHRSASEHSSHVLTDSASEIGSTRLIQLFGWLVWCIGL